MQNQQPHTAIQKTTALLACPASELLSLTTALQQRDRPVFSATNPGKIRNINPTYYALPTIVLPL